MIGKLIKYGLILIVGILGYNYFLGSPEEKASSRKIFQEVKEVGVEVGNLVKSEKQKFDKGKYDGALRKVKGVYENLKDKASYLDDKVMSRLDKLDDERADLEKRLENVSEDNTDEAKKTRKNLKKDLDKLLKETEDLVKNLRE